MPRLILLTLAAMHFLQFTAGATPSTSGAEFSWPGWRGPDRDGKVVDFKPPAKWPDQLTKCWQVEVGAGYGTPVVSGDRVYQHARQGDEEVIWCLDLRSGEVQWRKSYPAPFKIGGGGEYHGKGPKSSPVLADGRLFTLSITGVLSAWDAESGELLWRHDSSSQFQQGHPYWGVSTSPLVDGERVIVHLGGDEQGALMAFSAADGAKVWSHGDDGASYASPILVEIDGVRQIIDLTMDGLVGVGSESGEPLWKYPYRQEGTDQNMVTPVFHRGFVLLGGENRGIRSLEPKRTDGQWKVNQRWHQEQVALDMSSAVINGDLLYGFSHYDKGRIFCLDPLTGEVLWEGPGRTGENVMFLSVLGHVVALVDDGQLQVIKATGQRFEPVATYRVADGDTWAPPVLLQNKILTKDRQTLTLWSLPR